MTWDEVLKAAAAIAGLIAVGPALLAMRPRWSRRAQIKASAEILALLPRESTSRDSLLRHIDQQVTELLHDEDEKSRDLKEAFGGLYCVVAGVWLAVIEFGSAWLVPLWAFMSLLGGAMIWDGLPNSHRDENGLRIVGSNSRTGDAEAV